MGAARPRSASPRDKGEEEVKGRREGGGREGRGKREDGNCEESVISDWQRKLQGSMESPDRVHAYITRKQIIKLPRHATEAVTQKQPPAQQYTRPPTTQSPVDPNLKTVDTMPQLSTLREKYWGKETFTDIDSDLRQPFLTYLREYASSCAREQKYDEAKIAQSMSLHLKSQIDSTVPAKERDNDSVKLEESKEKLEEIHNQRIEDTEKSFAEQKQAMVQRHEEEGKKFEKLWADEMPRKYRKPSPKLLSLMHVEKALIESCDYDRAEAIRKEISNISADEAQQAQEKIFADYKLSKEKLEKQHESDLQLLDTERIHQIDLVKAKNSFENQSFINRENVVQKKQSEEKPKHVVATTGSIYYSAQKKKKESSSFLLPIKAPNDPEYVKQVEKKQRDEARKNEAFAQEKAAQESAAKKKAEEKPKRVAFKSDLPIEGIFETTATNIVESIEGQAPEADVRVEEPKAK